MTFIELSERLDSYTIEIYELLASSAMHLDLSFMVIGATARNLMLEWVYNILPYRVTEDIDLGVRVSGWEQFEQLKNTLLETGKFNETRLIHRLKYDETHPIDIVPFGIICGLENRIEWPPDNEIQMNVTGFREAYEHSVTVRLRSNPLLEIQVASLASQVVLKLIAWKDRGMIVDKDAKDIAIIINHYGSTVNEDRLFDQESEIMELEEFDIDFAGARLLGRDIAKVSNSEIRATLMTILEEETSEQGNTRLAEAMMNSYFGEEFENSLLYLKKLKNGLEDHSS